MDPLTLIGFGLFVSRIAQSRKATATAPRAQRARDVSDEDAEDHVQASIVAGFDALSTGTWDLVASAGIATTEFIDGTIGGAQAAADQVAEKTRETVNAVKSRTVGQYVEAGLNTAAASTGPGMAVGALRGRSQVASAIAESVEQANATLGDGIDAALQGAGQTVAEAAAAAGDALADADEDAAAAIWNTFGTWVKQ